MSSSPTSASERKADLRGSSLDFGDAHVCFGAGSGHPVARPEMSACSRLRQERTLATPKEAEHWPLTTLQKQLVKIRAKVVAHGRYVTFQLAEVAVPRELFR